MDTQPKIPTLKDSQKPQVKVRGLEAGVTLFDRLKQFKKKDLAFILAGLGTLFMAPLAEHFMMSPESGEGQLSQGWGGKGAGGKGMFDGSGASPYEPGTTGLAPGSAVGGGSDIITPLNVRDPSALVMGPGATQQPPTQSVMPATPPPTAVATKSDDYKDALAASARGVGAAAHAAKALLPIPKIALAGSGGLRGLGVVSGGTSAVAGNAPSSGGLVSGRAANNGSMPGVRGGGNIKSVSRSSTGGGTGGDAALKAAGDAAAGMFNKGSANQGLNDAANTAIPAGGGALGGNGAGAPGATDKATGGDQNKDGKNVGESLAFLKQKAIQEAQIALWAKEQEAGDNKLEALKIRNSMAEAFTSKIAGMAADQVGCVINSSGSNCPGGPASGSVGCNAGSPTGPIQVFPDGKPTCSGSAPKPGDTSTSSYAHIGNSLYSCSNGTMGTQVGWNCGAGTVAGTGGGTTPPPAGPPSGLKDPLAPAVGSIGGLNNSPVADLAGACQNLTKLNDQLAKVPNPTAELTAARTMIPKLVAQGKMIAEVSDDLGNTGATGTGGSLTSSGACGAVLSDIPLKGSVPISTQLRNLVDAGGTLTAANDGILARMDKATIAVKDPPEIDLAKLATDVGDGTKTGATGAIATFVADVATVKGAYNPDTTLMTGDPLNVAVLGPQLKTFYGDNAPAITAGLTDAQSKIQSSAGVVGPIVKNVDLATNDLKPVVKPLTDSVAGDQATLPALVKVNNALDNVGGQPAMQVPAPLKVAIDPSVKADATTPTAMSGPLKTADTDIKAAATAVKTYAGTTTPTAATVTPDPSATCASDPCTKAQTALDTAGKDVSTVRADQTGITASIRTAAGAAMGRLSGTTP